MRDTDGRREDGHLFRWERTHEALIAACVAALRAGRVPSLEEIMQQAGVSRQTVYNHFSDLPELHSLGLRIIQGHNVAPDVSRLSECRL